MPSTPAYNNSTLGQSIFSTGNKVGIGTTTPSGQLHVIGTGLISSRLGINNPVPSSVLDVIGESRMQGILYFNQNSTDAGDGTRNNCKIERITAQNLVLTGGSNTIQLAGDGGKVILRSSTVGVEIGSQYSNTYVMFNPGNSEKARITTSGLLGIGTSSPTHQLHVVGSGFIASGLAVSGLLSVNGTGISVSGHTHTSSNITDFNSTVSGLLPVKDIVAGTNVTVSSSSGIYTINSTAAGGGGGIVIGNSGDNRILTSTGSTSGINAESNLTFDGSLLNITGSGRFASGLLVNSSLTLNGSGVVVGSGTGGRVTFWGTNGNNILDDYSEFVWDSLNNRLGLNTASPSTTLHVNGDTYTSDIIINNQTANTILSLNGSKFVTSLSTTTYPSLTELSYVKGVTSAIQTQINTKQNTLTNPVTGVGVSGYVSRWTSSSGVGSGILYDDGVKVGIGTITPTGNLHVIGTGIFSSRLGVATNSPITAGHIFGTLTVDGFGQSANLYSEGIRIGAASNGYAVVTFGANTANPSGAQANQWWIGKDGRDNGFNIFVSGAGSDSFHITTGGNVGIRTISPTAQLHVNGSGFIASGLTVSGLLTVNGTGVSISGHTHSASEVGAISGVGASGYLARWTASSGISSGILYDNGSGVGIKTQSPTADLHVNGSGYFASGCNISGILNAQVIRQPIVSGTDAATITFDMNQSNVHTVRLGGNRTLAVTNVAVGQRFTIRLKQDTSPPRTVTWFSGIYWPSNRVPILTRLSNAVDVFSFICTASGKYDGYIVGYNFPNA